MFDTKLPAVDRLQLPRGIKSRVIEIGGTNLRTASVFLDENGDYVVEDFNKVELDKTNHVNADYFFDSVLDKLQLDCADVPSALGIIWSFPGESIEREDGTGVDIISEEKLPKGFTIPGISNRPLGEVFRERLHKRNGWDLKMPIAVMNDTRAVEGGIVGTGFNLAFGKYNTESGRFKLPENFIHTPEIFRILDEMSENPGAYLTEKQISGKYLQRALNIGIDNLNMMSFDPQYKKSKSAIIPQEETKFISGMLAAQPDSELQALVNDPEMFEVLRYSVEELSTRSAEFVGTLVDTGIREARKINPKNVVEYPIEGSVFWGIPGYKEVAEYHANQILLKAGKKVLFIEREHAGLKGAGGAALAQMTA